VVGPHWHHRDTLGEPGGAAVAGTRVSLRRFGDRLGTPADLAGDLVWRGRKPPPYSRAEDNVGSWPTRGSTLLAARPPNPGPCSGQACNTASWNSLSGAALAPAHALASCHGRAGTRFFLADRGTCRRPGMRRDLVLVVPVTRLSTFTATRALDGYGRAAQLAIALLRRRSRCLTLGSLRFRRPVAKVVQPCAERCSN